MNTVTLNQSSRRLPSIDWIALGVGVIGLALSRVPGVVWSSWTGLLGLAIFGPPLLRELGLITDEDEYSQSIRWRAGFHAILVVAALVFLNKALYPLIASHPDAMVRKVYFFPVDFLRQSLVLAFLISYLIQYWGASRGVFRLLLGLAGLTVIEMGMVLAFHHTFEIGVLLAGFAIVLFTVGAAYFTKVKPKPGGYLLLLAGMIFVIYDIYMSVKILPTENLSMTLQMGQGVVILVLFFAPTGFSLIKSVTDDAD